MAIMASLSNSEGEFIYSLGKDTPLASHSRVSGAAFQETKLLQAKPRTEVSGGPLERRELQGVCYELNSDILLAALWALKEQNQPVVLVIAGNVLGLWTIGQVRERNTETVPDGKSRKVSFSVQLQEFANAQSDPR